MYARQPRIARSGSLSCSDATRDSSVSAARLSLGSVASAAILSARTPLLRAARSLEKRLELARSRGASSCPSD
jgi:hypothetical protein